MTNRRAKSPARSSKPPPTKEEAPRRSRAAQLLNEMEASGSLGEFRPGPRGKCVGGAFSVAPTADGAARRAALASRIDAQMGTDGGFSTLPRGKCVGSIDGGAQPDVDQLAAQLPTGRRTGRVVTSAR